MQIDRSRPDGAPPGQRHLRLAFTGDQRTEHVEAGPHFTDEIIGRERICDGGGMQLQLRARLLLNRHSQMGQKLPQKTRIAQTWRARQDELTIGQKRRRHQLERGVLGAGNLNRAVQRTTATNANTIHITSILLRLPLVGPHKATENFKGSAYCGAPCTNQIVGARGDFRAIKWKDRAFSEAPCGDEDSPLAPQPGAFPCQSAQKRLASLCLFSDQICCSWLFRCIDLQIRSSPVLAHAARWAKTPALKTAGETPTPLAPL